MKPFLRDNGLTLALMLLFLASLVGQALTPLDAQNQERLEHGQAAIGLFAFLTCGQFLSTLFETWQSEFLSNAVLVVLAIFLRERGSPESKRIGAPHARTGS